MESSDSTVSDTDVVTVIKIYEEWDISWTCEYYIRIIKIWWKTGFNVGNIIKYQYHKSICKDPG
jgi:hypothetical protein